ncbi:8188_t:CDS:2 [Ambispora leptoticha]|uniref:8188_t:CDS:1 n=1 Tax=Ambispora leptoticha TaxID=144679 RepID=A0A9N8ZAN7_9GLOM|nr:8188_t:CDS:2 [Ambispora leptoticha]
MSTTQNRLNPGVPFSEFSNPKAELITENALNALDIYCPQPLCQSFILRQNLGSWVEKPKGKHEELQPYWRLTEMMDFENIGFLKTVELTGIKYLICADCDFGPLGYHETNAPENEYFIAADFVRYKKKNDNSSD